MLIITPNLNMLSTASVCCLALILLNVAEELHCLAGEWLIVINKWLHFYTANTYSFHIHVFSLSHTYIVLSHTVMNPLRVQTKQRKPQSIMTKQKPMYLTSTELYTNMVKHVHQYCQWRRECMGVGKCSVGKCLKWKTTKQKPCELGRRERENWQIQPSYMQSGGAIRRSSFRCYSSSWRTSATWSVSYTGTGNHKEPQTKWEGSSPLTIINARIYQTSIIYSILKFITYIYHFYCTGRQNHNNHLLLLPYSIIQIP